LDAGDSFGADRSPAIGGAVRIAVIADIHGNLSALEAVIADIERRAMSIASLISAIACQVHSGHGRSAISSWCGMT
jgi:hypothetical protein